MSRHDLVTTLHNTLTTLAANPYPYLAGPDSIKKRASVSLIVRIQPSYSHWPGATTAPAKDLDVFFQQAWVQHGEPEVLFIKRAARKGDRWTSHVALPGGRRDPDDADDQAAAVRETIEEVGIGLSPENAIPVGNLPQRVVTTSWGKVPLMVLCPYVFLLTNPHMPPMRLQPTEVASTHWVPLRALLSPDQRTSSYEDVSNRLANQETGVKRWMLRAMLGQMEFSAIHLLPSESLHCTQSPAEETTQKNELAQSYAVPSALTKVWERYSKPTPPQSKPLLLWGLTLGVMADFLDMFPPNNALELWTYPTFTPWDVRFTIWAMSRKFKKDKIRALQTGEAAVPPVPAVEGGLDAAQTPVPKRMHSSRYLTRNKSLSESQTLESTKGDDVGLPGLGSGKAQKRKASSAVGTLLDGYYNILRKAVGLALLGRTTILTLLFTWLIVRSRRRQTVVRVN